MDGREKMYFYVARQRTDDFAKAVEGFDPRFDPEKRRWEIDVASGEKSNPSLVSAAKLFGWQSPGFFEAQRERVAGLVEESERASRAERAASAAMADEAAAGRLHTGPIEGPFVGGAGLMVEHSDQVAMARQKGADWECMKALQAGAAERGLWFQSTFMANGFMLPGRGGGRESQIATMPGVELRKAMWTRGTTGEVGGDSYAKRDIGLALLFQASVQEIRLMMARNSELHDRLWEQEDRGRFRHAVVSDPSWKASVAARISRLGEKEGMEQGFAAFRSLPFEEAKRVGGPSVLNESERNKMVGLDNGWKQMRDVYEGRTGVVLEGGIKTSLAVTGEREPERAPAKAANAGYGF